MGMLCLVVSFVLAVLVARPQSLPLDQLRELEPSELQSRFGLPEAAVRDEILCRYAARVLLPTLVTKNSTAILLAAVLGSYLVGRCLARPVQMEQYAGSSRTVIALR